MFGYVLGGGVSMLINEMGVLVAGSMTDPL
jgi:hypothetical protein